MECGQYLSVMKVEKQGQEGEEKKKKRSLGEFGKLISDER